MNRLVIGLLVTVFAALSFAQPAWTHTKIKTSTLEDGKTYQSLPETIDLVFAQKVGLVDLSLKTADGADIPLSFDKPKGMYSTFTIPRPALGPGNYVLSWRIIAKDGHILNGEIAFIYEP